MKICLFADVNPELNPYILIFKNTLERQELVVTLKQRLDLKWLLTEGRTYDCIHLHWIGSAYRPEPLKFSTTNIVEDLINSAPIKAYRSLLRLVIFSLALLLSRILGKTIVYTVHNLPERSKKNWFSDSMEKISTLIIFSLSHRIHVQNKHTQRILEVDYNRINGVFVVPHGNYIRYYDNQVSQHEARQRIGIPNSAFVYLFFGLLRPYKGIEDLITAFETLISDKDQELISSKLLIVGSFFSDANYEQSLTLRASKTPGIELIPKFVSNEEIQVYMNACNACVLPYKNITTSGAALLSLSFGRPLIAPAIATFPELVTEDVGILYDPSKPTGLLTALRNAAKRNWSEKTILEYAQKFDWEKLGPRLAALYR